MAIVEFPPIEKTNTDGLLAVGGDLEVPSLILAYTSGIFPWPVYDFAPMTWFCPDPRGVLRHEDLHVSKSLKKIMKKNNITFSFNKNFKTVIYECMQAKNRKGQNGTWITPEIVEGYQNLHSLKLAYSVEVYQDNKLSGGMYGVNIGNFISGESMFFKVSNHSKLALIYLMDFLAQKGIYWIDTQMTTQVIKNMGGIEIERDQFLMWLKKSLSNWQLKKSVFDRV